VLLSFIRYLKEVGIMIDLIGLIIALGVLVAAFVGAFYGYLYEKKTFNKGCCPNCKGTYKSFDMASDGSVGYSCSNCDKTVWISWHHLTKKKG